MIGFLSEELKEEDLLRKVVGGEAVCLGDA